MWAFYQTPIDILYFVLTVSIGLVALLLALALYHVIRILKNVRSVTEKTKDTIDLLNHYLWQPIKIMMMIIEKGKEYATKARKKASKKTKK